MRGLKSDTNLSSSLLKIFLSLLLLSGCIRLAGGAFYAKKEKPEEPAKVREIYLDTGELLGKKAPGKIE